MKRIDRRWMRAALATIPLTAAVAFSGAFKAAASDDPILLNAVAFESGRERDELRLYSTAPLQPEVRYGLRPTRIVIEFENAHPLDGLRSAVAQQRGRCVSRFEIVSFREGSAEGEATAFDAPKGSNGALKNRTFLIAYTDAGARLTAVNSGIGYTGLDFTCDPDSLIDLYPPWPFNRLERVYIERYESRDVINLEFARPVEPLIEKLQNPPRASYSFPLTIVQSREAELARNAALEAMVRPEIIGVASQPSPYDQMDEDTNFRFVGESSLYSVDEFSQKQWGLQDRSFVFVLHEDDKALIENLPPKNPKTVSISVSREFPARAAGENVMCVEVPTMGFPVRQFAGYGVEDEEGNPVH